MTVIATIFESPLWRLGPSDAGSSAKPSGLELRQRQTGSNWHTAQKENAGPCHNLNKDKHTHAKTAWLYPQWLHSLHKYFSAVVFPLRISILKKYIGQSEFCCNSTKLVELPCSGRSSLSLRTEVFQYSELFFPQVDILHCEKPLVYCLRFQGHYHIKTNGNHTLVWKVSLSAIWDYLPLQAKSKTNHFGILCSLRFGKHFPQSLSLSSIREAWQQWQKKKTQNCPVGKGAPAVPCQAESPVLLSAAYLSERAIVHTEAPLQVKFSISWTQTWAVCEWSRKGLQSQFDCCWGSRPRTEETLGGFRRTAARERFS